MNGQGNWLLHEHSLYEDLLAECRDAAEIEDWDTVDLGFESLVAHLKRHMAMEEAVLYPAYEAAPDAPQGPTHALREEHGDIVRLVGDMARLIRTRDSGIVLDGLAQLEERMIKHHEKEEDIFLPMAGHILRASRDELLRRMEEFDYDAAGPQRQWDL